jgi:hypothetical protein
MDTVAGGQHSLEPGLQFGEQVVEAQLRQDRLCFWFHRRPSSMADPYGLHSP